MAGHGVATISSRFLLLRMDSCTEGEQDEFFESLEAIPSSASSENESGGEEDLDFCQPPPAAMAKASIENHPVSFSRYEVWQSDSGSIFERRQRLFTQMGLKLDSEDSGKATDAHFSEMKERSQDKFETGLSYAVEPVNSTDYMKDCLKDNGLTSSQASASNTREAEDCSVRFVLAQTHKQHTDANCAGLKSGSSGHSSRRGNSAGEGVVSNQLSSGNGDPLQDFVSLDRDSADCTTSHDGRLSLKESLPVQTCQDAELLCRIKDLDTGKEFVVNEVGKDGLWNKLKELHTGKELTLEEFESSLGLSPIVQEVMKRERASDDGGATELQLNIITGNEKKKRAWFKVIKGFVNSSRDKGHYKSGSNGSMEKSGRRSSSESNDSRETPLQLAKRVKVHAHKKSTKEFANLYLRQEFRAHQGAIWTMKFSFDGSLLASAGQDKVVRVWEVLDHDRLARSPSDKSGDSCSLVDTKGVDNLLQCQSHLKGSVRGTSGQTAALSSKTPFLLSEKPKCTFNGHAEDVLDLSWSHSQFLLSSSMDRTVRLWNVMSGECSRIFAHNDYVTCIHFNPVDDGYFISGSLDGKVRIWSIKEHQVVDWVDLSEMVTAACYTQNGQGAVVGSYKGTCHFYKTSDSKLQFDTKFEVQRKKKRRSPGKKITGFQFIPGDEKKILITSSDSRIRVYDGSNISSKYKGLRNSNSQISASVSLNGMYVICASEDSRVCIWKYYESSLYPVQKQKTLSGSYEDFLAQHVLIAIPWPGVCFKSFREKPNDHSSMISGKLVNNSETNLVGTGCLGISTLDKNSKPDIISCCEVSPYHSVNGDSMRKNVNPTVLESATSCHSEQKQQASCQEESSYSLDGASIASPMLNSYLEDCCSVLSKVGQDQLPFSERRGSATWPEENLPSVQKGKCSNGEKGAVYAAHDLVDQKVSAITAAWGLIIVTAGLEGDIQVFQNQSLPD